MRKNRLRDILFYKKGFDLQSISLTMNDSDNQNDSDNDNDKNKDI